MAPAFALRWQASALPESINLVITHYYHEDHYEGADELVNGPDPIQVVVVHDREDKTFLPAEKLQGDRFVEYETTLGHRAHHLMRGETIPLDPAMTITCIASGSVVLGEEPVAHGAHENDMSIALLIQYGTFRYFVGGGIEGHTESKIAQRDPIFSPSSISYGAEPMQLVPSSSIRKRGTFANVHIPTSVSTVCPHCSEKALFSLSGHSEDRARTAVASSALCPGCGRLVHFWTVLDAATPKSPAGTTFMYPVAKDHYPTPEFGSDVPDPLRKAFVATVDAYNSGIYVQRLSALAERWRDIQISCP